MNKVVILIFINIFFCFCIYTQKLDDNIVGCDISYLNKIEKSGGKYYLDGKEENLFFILKKAGFNTVRMRIWDENSDGDCSIQDYIDLAKKSKSYEMKTIMCLHYSDTWADPGNQSKPKKWENLKGEDLKRNMKEWTLFVLEKCKENNVIPDFVQIGNEVSSGLLWNDGRIGGEYNNNWNNFIGLLKESIEVVRSFSKDIKIIIHHNEGSRFEVLDWFYGKLSGFKVDFDIVGLSYYPFYSKDPIEKLFDTTNKIQKKYGKKVLILETSYPWTYLWNDNVHNAFGKGGYNLIEYDVSPEGQAKYFEKLINEMKKNKALGVVYWGGEWISTKSFGSMWENQALFDFGGNALPIILNRVKVLNSK